MPYNDPEKVRQYLIRTKEIRTKKGKEYYQKNKERIKERQKKYRKEKYWNKHLEYNEKWFNEHPNYKKEWAQKPENKEKRKEWMDSPNGKISMWKHKHIHHREFGFKPMNEPFEGCEAHHIDKVNVIFVSKHINQIPHRQNNEEQMKYVNILAWTEMEAGVL